MLARAAVLLSSESHRAKQGLEYIRGMAQWLEQDYGLTPSEIAQVLGTSVQLNINEVADRNAGVVAKLSKQQLAALKKQ